MCEIINTFPITFPKLVFQGKLLMLELENSTEAAYEISNMHPPSTKVYRKGILTVFKSRVQKQVRVNVFQLA